MLKSVQQVNEVEHQ